jgi:hypothetical protein
LRWPYSTTRFLSTTAGFWALGWAATRQVRPFARKLTPHACTVDWSDKQ